MTKLIAKVAIVSLMLFSFEAFASTDKEHPKKMEWAFDGFFGSVDREAAQRGLKVYKEVCSVCHSLKRVAFRNLEDLGFSQEEIKSLAAGYNVQDGPNDEGEMFERPGRASDHFPSPYANEKAARAANNNGALPPDLSLIIKAREDGANYVYSLLTGYDKAPEGFALGNNMHYNPYYGSGGRQFSMIPPLTADGQVEYTDGVKSTVDQMARDVVNFLQWAAEPEMEARKRLGFMTIIFTGIFTGIFYFAYKRIWKKIK